MARKKHSNKKYIISKKLIIYNMISLYNTKFEKNIF